MCTTYRNQELNFADRKAVSDLVPSSLKIYNMSQIIKDLVRIRSVDILIRNRY